MKYLFVVNPNSGKRKAVKRMELLKLRLDREEFVYMIYETTPTHYAKELREVIENNNITHVFAVGGDGTAHEVVNAVAGLDVKFGIIPFGSGNDFARMMGIKGSINEVLTMIKEDRAQMIDIGQVDKYYFLNYFSFGFDVAICRNANRFRKLFGAAYILGFLYTIFSFKSRPMIIDGKKEIYAITSIHNGKYYGGGIKVNPMGDVTDGRFNFLGIKTESRFRLFIYYVLLFLGFKLKNTKRITQQQVTSFSFEIDEPLTAGVDGEFYPFDQSIEVKILPSFVKFIY